MEITLILPISRDTFLTSVINTISQLDMRGLSVTLFCYVDGQHPLYERTRNLVARLGVPHLTVMRKKTKGAVDSVARRRIRIAAVHNEIRTLIDTVDGFPFHPHLLLLEDDGLLSANTIQILAKRSNLFPHAGFISGIEAGRHGVPYLGAWRADTVYEPREIHSIEYTEGVQEVDAAGLYCLLIRKDLYIHHQFELFDGQLGPDINLGLRLRCLGYKNYVDTQLSVRHMTKKGTILVKKDTPQVVFTKRRSWEFALINYRKK